MYMYYISIIYIRCCWFQSLCKCAVCKVVKLQSAETEEVTWSVSKRFWKRPDEQNQPFGISQQCSIIVVQVQRFAGMNWWPETAAESNQIPAGVQLHLKKSKKSKDGKGRCFLPKNWKHGRRLIRRIIWTFVRNSNQESNTRKQRHTDPTDSFHDWKCSV